MPLPGAAEKFQSKNSGGTPRSPSPVTDREVHARGLLAQLSPIVEAAERVSVRTDIRPEENGVYVEVTGRAGQPLISDSLERRQSGIELLGVRTDGATTRATVFVPVKARDRLGAIVEEYRTETEPRSKTGAPKHRRFVESIGAIRLARLRDLWMDDPEKFPAEGITTFWETWLRPGTENRLHVFAQRLGLELGRSGLVFPEASAVRVRATPEQMADLSELSLSVAQVRRTSVTAEFFDSLPPGEQHAFSEELRRRVRYPEAGAQAAAHVCILDTGVNRGHALLAPALADADCHAVDPGWGEDDHHGHGTELAGIALLGDLVSPLDANVAIEIGHRLESVKILPPRGENPYDLLGAITRDGVNVAETQGPDRRRVFCMATTTEDDTPHYGVPTSWSSELDQIAAGVTAGEDENAPARLICVSAGNLRRPDRTSSDYPDGNDVAEAESPAHAWNALTVGACTEKIVLTDPTLAGYQPLARSGDLAPNSRTASWSDTWPSCPDLVLEGGNLAVDPDGRVWSVPDLMVLTTSRDYPNPVFSLTADTSAATAEAARYAAILQSEYPGLWPETIRGLLVGSCRWTDRMRWHLHGSQLKADYALLMQRFGHGVPNLGRARHSASNVLTLIAQDELQPYTWSEKSSAPILNEMKLFALPWPQAALQALQAAEVRMRVTLSYFIEPNPSETMRNRKARYASHGLRFRVKEPDETNDYFRKRINKAALEDGEKVGGGSTDGAQWTIGPDHREVGSIHSDTWTGPASDLALRGTIAVFPVGGWWKERKHLGRWNRKARFSLIVTIDAGEAETDIYTPVETVIANTIAVRV